MPFVWSLSIFSITSLKQHIIIPYPVQNPVEPPRRFMCKEVHEKRRAFCCAATRSPRPLIQRDFQLFTHKFPQLCMLHMCSFWVNIRRQVKGLTCFLKYGERAATTIQSMRLPPAVVNRYKAWTTAFIVVGDWVYANSKPVMLKRISPQVRMMYWGRSHIMCSELAWVTSSMSTRSSSPSDCKRLRSFV